jgi:hypothetical protein
LSVSTTPLLFWLSLAPADARPEGARRELLAREGEPLLERDAVLRLRVAGDAFERDEAPEERDEPPEERDEPPEERDDPLALAFEPDRLDELLLRCVLREAALPAISHPRSIETFFFDRVPIAYTR